MSKLYTIPSQTAIDRSLAQVPDYMRPNKIPNAAVISGVIADSECDLILERAMETEPYSFKQCGAETRELPREPIDESMRPFAEVVQTLNQVFWKYDLDPDPAAWLQTYSEGSDYKLHTDTAPAQMRKLSAVLMLSDNDAYDGGNLRLRLEPRWFPIVKTRGTIVVFQPWVPHEVTPVTRGTRQTINLGFWGPPFR